MNEVARPLALDLFCGAGGAAMGLFRAGFDVLGIDHRKQPRYPFPFIQADALAPPVDLSRFDLIWASPPCQAFSAITRAVHRANHPNLIDPIRQLLSPYDRTVIENVPGAPLFRPIILCGSAFGLRVRRHRCFEMSFPVLVPECRHKLQGAPLDVTGTGGRRLNRKANDHGGRLNAARTVGEARDGMGMVRGTYVEVAQATPPAYAEFIGHWAMRSLPGARAA